MSDYCDPTTGQWVGEHETRPGDGTVTRTTEWFETPAEARRYARTGPLRPCTAVLPGRGTCNRPAKAALLGNAPVCGIHARAAAARGEEIYPLQAAKETPPRRCTCAAGREYVAQCPFHTMEDYDAADRLRSRIDRVVLAETQKEA